MLSWISRPNIDYVLLSDGQIGFTAYKPSLIRLSAVFSCPFLFNWRNLAWGKELSIEGLKEVLREASKEEARPSPRVLAVVYQGHGDRDIHDQRLVLTIERNTVRFAELISVFLSSSYPEGLFLIDSCHAGAAFVDFALAAAGGASSFRRKPMHLIAAANDVAMAVSQADESCREAGSFLVSEHTHAMWSLDRRCPPVSEFVIRRGKELALQRRTLSPQDVVTQFAHSASQGKSQLGGAPVYFCANSVDGLELLGAKLQAPAVSESLPREGSGALWITCGGRAYVSKHYGLYSNDAALNSISTKMAELERMLWAMGVPTVGAADVTCNDRIAKIDERTYDHECTWMLTYRGVQEFYMITAVLAMVVDKVYSDGWADISVRADWASEPPSNWSLPLANEVLLGKRGDWNISVSKRFPEVLLRPLRLLCDGHQFITSE